jgi:hypothetical protein
MWAVLCTRESDGELELRVTDNPNQIQEDRIDDSIKLENLDASKAFLELQKIDDDFEGYE